jgi:hypothetical protein
MSSSGQGLALQVVADPVLAGTPGAHPGDFLAGQASGEHRVAHQVPGRAHRGGIGLDAEVAENFEGTLVGDVRPRAVGQPVPFCDDPDRHAIRGQRERSGRAGRAGADDQDVRVEIAALAHLLAAAPASASMSSELVAISASSPSELIDALCASSSAALHASATTMVR